MKEKKELIVHEHMSETKLREMINEKMPLSPRRAERLLANLERKLSEMPLDKNFEEYYQIYHTDEALFYYIGYGRPDPYLDYVFLNKKFIIYIYR